MSDNDKTTVFDIINTFAMEKALFTMFIIDQGLIADYSQYTQKYVSNMEKLNGMINYDQR